MTDSVTPTKALCGAEKAVRLAAGIIFLRVQSPHIRIFFVF